VFDLRRNLPTRLTFDPKDDIWPVWSPDGKWIAFASNRGGRYALYRKLASGAGADELLYSDPKANLGPTDWSPDGKWIALAIYPESGTPDVFLLPTAGEAKPVPFLQTAFSEGRARFSPDGRFMAYESDESGRPEVYVQPVPASGARWQVSTSGGRTPFWTARGREIAFVGADRAGLFSAAVSVAAGGLQVSLPRRLFERLQAPGGIFRNRYVPDAAGARFLLNVARESTEPSTFHVVLDWPASIARR
jgi:Tol biopolymer transport system component